MTHTNLMTLCHTLLIFWPPVLWLRAGNWTDYVYFVSVYYITLSIPEHVRRMEKKKTWKTAYVAC